MQVCKWALGAAVCLVLGGAVIVVADDVKPADATPPVRHERKNGVRVDRPYNMLTDLTDDQKAKIIEIHKAELDAVKALQEKEKSDIMAVLTPDQQKQLSDLEAKAKLEREAAMEQRKAKTEEEKAQELKNRADHMSTTQPSDAK